MLSNRLDIRVYQTLFTEDRFASLFKTVDRLHDVVSEGKLEQVTNLSPEEVIGWLQDIAYTINETIRELQPSAETEEADQAW
ncbi:MAG: hypothetical protein DYG88_10175 [Chloroflexi bacterium CFX4]|nr:hypothetical protein [Chloroflexi bacterium CFX4]MDL1923774.1 hypothetical protein [Chloroflexi bacterium CFX3]